MNPLDQTPNPELPVNPPPPPPPPPPPEQINNQAPATPFIAPPPDHYATSPPPNDPTFNLPLQGPVPNSNTSSLKILLILAAIFIFIVLFVFITFTLTGIKNKVKQVNSLPPKSTYALNSLSSGSFRDPNISNEITLAGQKIIFVNTGVIKANVDWVNTDLKVQTGEYIWSTTASNGEWSGNPKYYGYSDANGLNTYPAGYKIDSKANALSLIGFIGSSPPEVSQQQISVNTPAGGSGGENVVGMFEPGNTLKDYFATSSGTIWLRNNDNTNYRSDVGSQTVRLFITAKL